jgi:hypothetical protein
LLVKEDTDDEDLGRNSQNQLTKFLRSLAHYYRKNIDVLSERLEAKVPLLKKLVRVKIFRKNIS